MHRLEPMDGGVRIPIRVQPRASKSEMAGLHDGAVKIRLQAPPLEGKANQALLKFLSTRLGVPVSALCIVAGEKSRNKIVEVAGVTLEAVQAAIQTP